VGARLGDYRWAVDRATRGFRTGAQPLCLRLVYTTGSHTAQSDAMPPETDPAQPRLVAQIQGFRGARFDCVGGFGGQIDVMAFKDGPERVIRQQGGRTGFDRVTLRRPQTGAPVLWKWWKAATAGADKRRDVTLALTDARGRELAKWVLNGCWPCHWRLKEIEPERGKRVYAEEVTLIVENIDLA